MDLRVSVEIFAFLLCFILLSLNVDSIFQISSLISADTVILSLQYTISLSGLN
ncbi:hypothetical protein BD408DRAFT_426892, partial [Parasitella parasitica]